MSKADLLQVFSQLKLRSGPMHDFSLRLVFLGDVHTSVLLSVVTVQRLTLIKNHAWCSDSRKEFFKTKNPSGNSELKLVEGLLGCEEHRQGNFLLEKTPK